jgi:hypothetical protein
MIDRTPVSSFSKMAASSARNRSWPSNEKMSEMRMPRAVAIIASVS